MSFTRYLSEVSATVTCGDCAGEMVYIASTFDDMCLCNIGLDEQGVQKYAMIPRNHLIPHTAQASISTISGVRSRTSGPQKTIDWSFIHDLLCSPA